MLLLVSAFIESLNKNSTIIWMSKEEKELKPELLGIIIMMGDIYILYQNINHS